jgi:hypothetical protein
MAGSHIVKHCMQLTAAAGGTISLQLQLQWPISASLNAGRQPADRASLLQRYSVLTD